ncbi:MAG: hypothetical protein KZY61_01570 [Clostridiaceae bacterium]|nr:hypothetical protein [Clostridiaceae bacterium]MBW4859500.1 hypothetical protein [Clostridiaceae bacterium]MBW4867345.1 hypothetical protein [Clostridiaceae bacterium]
MIYENDAIKRIVRLSLERNKRINGQDINLTIDDMTLSTNLRRTVSRKISDLQRINCIERIGYGKILIIYEGELIKILNS